MNNLNYCFQCTYQIKPNKPYPRLPKSFLKNSRKVSSYIYRAVNHKWDQK